MRANRVVPKAKRLQGSLELFAVQHPPLIELAFQRAKQPFNPPVLPGAANLAALMDNAIAYKDRLQLTLGVALNAEHQSIPGLKPLHPLWYSLVRIDAGPGFPGRSSAQALMRVWQRLVLPFVLVLIGRGSCNARLISYRWSAAVGTSRGGRQGALRGVSYIPKRNDIVIINSFLIYRASFIVTPSVAVTAKGDGGYPPG